jgi:hypothetical protein
MKPLTMVPNRKPNPYRKEVKIMTTTATTTPTQDFIGLVDACDQAITSAFDHIKAKNLDSTQGREEIRKASMETSFRHNLRYAAFIYGTRAEVRTSANRKRIEDILGTIGYTAKDTARWFEAVEVQYGLRETASYEAPVFAAA